uniref:Uncharacterized protein n=1 Tax=Globodera rostochiensis TaxID=31243 RepID=A0A914I872_GLORO
MLLLLLLAAATGCCNTHSARNATRQRKRMWRRQTLRKKCVSKEAEGPGRSTDPESLSQRAPSSVRAGQTPHKTSEEEEEEETEVSASPMYGEGEFTLNRSKTWSVWRGGVHAEQVQDLFSMEIKEGEQLQDGFDGTRTVQQQGGGQGVYGLRLNWSITGVHAERVQDLFSGSGSSTSMTGSAWGQDEQVQDSMNSTSPQGKRLITFAGPNAG